MITTQTNKQATNKQTKKQTKKAIKQTKQTLESDCNK